MCCSRWGRLLPMLLPMHHCLPPSLCCRGHWPFAWRVSVCGAPPPPSLRASCSLLQHAPPLFVLPPLGNTLDSSPASLAAAAAAAAPAKPAKGKSGGGKGGGGGKKKGVTFAAGEGDTSMGGNSGGGGDGESGGGGGAGGSGSDRAGSSLCINSGGNGSTLQQTSGGATTQGGGGGGAFATQGVAVAVSGGLGRMAAEGWKRRSLLLPALATLGVGAAAVQEQHCYAMLPSAAYVLADLHRCVPTCLLPIMAQGRLISADGLVSQTILFRWPPPACLPPHALLQQAQGGAGQQRQAPRRPWQAPHCAAAAAGGSGRSDGGAAAGGAGPCAARHSLPPGCR